MNNIIESALRERRIDVAEGDQTLRCKTRCEGHGVTLGDTHVEATLGHFVHHNVERTTRRHSGRDTHNAVVAACQIEQRLTENILITRGGIGRSAIQSLARFEVEMTRCVPHRLVLLGGSVTLTLDRQYVQQLGPFDLTQIAQRAHQRGKIVTVDRTEIAEAETLEQIAILQDTLLDDVACLLHRATQCGQRREGIPHAILETIVVARGGDSQ